MQSSAVLELNTMYSILAQVILEDLEGYKIMGIFRGFDYKGDSDLINALNIVTEEIPEINPVVVCSKDTLNGLKHKNKT